VAQAHNIVYKAHYYNCCQSSIGGCCAKMPTRIAMILPVFVAGCVTQAAAY
jgi:hypothetical protein